MEPYKKHESIAALMDRSNVDTDQIIPKQFLKRVERSGFGVHLFHDWRFNDDGTDNVTFELNKPAFKGARILVAGDNFGCGSSREHAPWAIADYGFNTIISTSYADIFYNNCFKNGILPIVLKNSEIDELLEFSKSPNNSATINLPKQEVQFGEKIFKFEIDSFKKHCLIEGLDDIGLTLQKSQKIADFEKQNRQITPWLYNN